MNEDRAMDVISFWGNLIPLYVYGLESLKAQLSFFSLNKIGTSALITSFIEFHTYKFFRNLYICGFHPKSKIIIEKCLI